MQILRSEMICRVEVSLNCFSNHTTVSVAGGMESELVFFCKTIGSMEKIYPTWMINMHSGSQSGRVQKRGLAGAQVLRCGYREIRLLMSEYE